MPRGVGRPGVGRLRHGLVVRRLDLVHADEDILGVVELVGVENVVFRGGADEPGALGGFDEHAAAGANDLGVEAVEVVIGGPGPHVFNVGLGGCTGEGYVSCIGRRRVRVRCLNDGRSRWLWNENVREVQY